MGKRGKIWSERWVDLKREMVKEKRYGVRDGWNQKERWVKEEIGVRDE